MTREMKYSGVEWIGDIPSEWKVEKNKHCFEFTKNIVGEEFENYKLLSLTKKGIVIKDENNSFGKVPDSYETYQSVKQGQLVLCLFDLDCSAVFSGLSNYDGMISPAYKIYNCKECIDKKYAEYWFDYCFDGRKYMIYSKSLRYVVNADDFGTIEIVLPPLSEQKKIADFLDGKVSEIDKIIAETKSSIENYKEYKQSVITEAVTKGLDKNVPMKDSRIEYISEIPFHWEMEKGKHILSLLSRPVKEDDEIITCFRDGEVTLRKKRREEGFTFSLKEIGYQGIEIGDLVVHGMDGFAGAIGISVARGKASPVLNVLDTNYNKRYIMYYLRSLAFNNIFSALATGIRVRSCDLRWNKLADLMYIIPPINEQEKIANYIDEKCIQIDKIISEKEELILDLEEYKRSLIYEYVTGKRTVE